MLENNSSGNNPSVVQANVKLKLLKSRLSHKIDKAIELGIGFRKYINQSGTIKKEDGIIQIFDDCTDEYFERLLDDEILKAHKKIYHETTFLRLLKEKNILK